MIKQIPTACSLICDNCKREYVHDKRHVFKTQNQSMIYAEQQGWNVDFQSGHAICPKCKNLSQKNFSVMEVKKALTNIAKYYHPQVGQKNNKTKIQDLLTKELKTDSSYNYTLWKICTEYKLVWYDEYSGIYIINLDLNQ